MSRLKIADFRFQIEGVKLQDTAARLARALIQSETCNLKSAI